MYIWFSRSGQSGLSLVELLVALIVGAVMIHALLTAQKYSLYLASEQQKRWTCLNLTQELFARQGLTHLTGRPSGTWVATQGSYKGRWRTYVLSSSGLNLGGEGTPPSLTQEESQTKQKGLTIDDSQLSVQNAYRWMQLETATQGTVLGWKILAEQ